MWQMNINPVNTLRNHNNPWKLLLRPNYQEFGFVITYPELVSEHACSYLFDASFYVFNSLRLTIVTWWKGKV